MRALLEPNHLRSPWMRRARLGCCLLILYCLVQPGPAQSNQGLTPDDVEAAYLYNFGKFVQWPSGASAGSQPFSICILGQDNFGSKLDDLIANETIDGRKIVARRLSSAATADNCRIVFIGPNEGARLTKDIAVLENKPVLTVSSLPGFLDHGGMIQFLLQDRRVRFAVNLSAAERVSLAMSSELLKVAVYVNTPTTREVAP